MLRLLSILSLSSALFHYVGLVAVAAQPNIVFILVDDMGWQDTSVPFHTKTTRLNLDYKTPNMNQLASDGLLFTNAYACSICSPTRVSWMTGQNAARHKVTCWTLRKDQSPERDSELHAPAPWNLNGLQPPGANVSRSYEAECLPMLLQSAGYRTIHAGKAHFGAQGTPGADPRNLGFDVNIAGSYMGGPGSYHGDKNFSAAWRGGGRIWDVPGLEKYHGQKINLTEAITREAIAEIEKTVAAEKPFFLYLSHYAVHAPFEPDRRFLPNYQETGWNDHKMTYASMLESMDHSLGDIRATIDRLGVADNTIVIFMSDNGSPRENPRNVPLRGHKISGYEGGTRVPLIVRWPGVTSPGRTDNPVIIEDIFPTLLDMAEVKKQPKVDGVSFVDILEGSPKTDRSRRAFFWHYPNLYDMPPYSAVRLGKFKLIYWHHNQRIELFNLETDLGEETNLAIDRPAITKNLVAELSQHLRKTNANMLVLKETQKPVPYPDEIERPSQLANRLEYKNIVINNPEMTTWGTSPIKVEDTYHLFAARWPSNLGVDPGWRSHSEIAHFSSDSPLGPFKFEKTVLAGTHVEGSWEKFAPHNPLIKKFGSTFAIFYIARTDPRRNETQRIGLATSNSIYGPWERRNAPILSPSEDPANWTHESPNGVNNPAAIQMSDGRVFLYFKARRNGGKSAQMGVAIANALEGPYVIQDKPITGNIEHTIEDGYAYASVDGNIHLLTTDNHGILSKGGGLHWVSKDGLVFGEPSLAFHRLDQYIKRSDYPKARRIYGSGVWKCERPQVLVEDGHPRYLYAPSGVSLDGDQATEAHVFEIRPK